MMRLLFLFLCVFILQMGNSQVQNRDRISYQALIFDGNNKLVQRDTVGVELSILKGTMNGNSVYTERYQTATDVNGLLTLEIGSGNVQSGVYDSIDWSSGPYFIKTKADPEGASNYSFTNITQMLSVPYALQAKRVEVEHDSVFLKSVASKITEADTTKWGKTLVAGKNINFSGDTISAQPPNLYLGKDTLGGLVFYIYYDSLQKLHGLVLNTEGMGAAIWQNVASKTNANRTWDGAYNTSLMTDSPAKDYIDGLNNSNSGGFNDWYLPALDEASLLFQNINSVYQQIENGKYPSMGYLDRAALATSTESDENNIFYYVFPVGYYTIVKKTIALDIIAIRAF